MRLLIPATKTGAVANLDLIVTCDTTIAHLAGALGRPVWVHLKQEPDCCWLLDREDCPWYPARRLFRHKARGDWADVFNRVAQALDAFRTNGVGQATTASVASLGAGRPARDAPMSPALVCRSIKAMVLPCQCSSKAAISTSKSGHGVDV